jgi:D-glycero-D-manno-heptose 1,7-bisphosphate phosphatase
VERKNRAVFLDRDGTINVEKGYVHKIEDFEFIPGVPRAINLFKNAGFLVIVVTNQSGVARGYYSIDAVNRLHGYMDSELARHGTSVDAYYVCPHHPQGIVGEFAKACDCRKPGPGMLLKAANDFSVDLASSFLIGDKQTDVEAALSAGCRPVLVETGFVTCGSAELPPDVPCFATLLDAARAITGDKNSVRCSTFNVQR